MAEIAATTDAFADIEAAEGLPVVLEDRSPPDRLPPMLFLAALIHGVLIVGVTFNAVQGFDPGDAISLEVTIVADPENERADPEDADYLAQASQRGAGNTRAETRPTAVAASQMPFDNAGQENGDAFRDALANESASDSVLATRNVSDSRASEDARNDPAVLTATAIAFESGQESTLPLPQDEQANPAIHDDNPRHLVTSVNTRQSNVAGYLHRWKSKIENTGVRYFPAGVLRQGHQGSPTLEVAINASGELHEVIVRRSSGSSALDQAALSILRRSAPFDPFPETIAADYDQLRFAYKWEFSEKGGHGAALLN